MSKPKRETYRHQAAFEYYYTVGLLDPGDRNLSEVARRFKISPQAAAGWSVAFKWQRRVKEREEMVSGLMREKSIEDEVTMRRRNLMLCQSVQNRFAELLVLKSIDPTPSDFEKIAKLELLLNGGATERSEVNVSAGIAGHLMTSILGVIETNFPERCPHCSRELDLKNTIANKLLEASEKLGSTDA